MHVIAMVWMAPVRNITIPVVGQHHMFMYTHTESSSLVYVVCVYVELLRVASEAMKAYEDTVYTYVHYTCVQ